MDIKPFTILKQTFLWQLFPPNKTSTSYLLGTMHVKDARVFLRQHHLLELIEGVDLYAAETDLRELQLQSNLQTMLIPGGRRLPDFFTEKQYAKMHRILKKAFGIDIHQFAHFRPFFISSMIDEAILSKDMPYSLDESLWRFADELGKDMKGVESYEHQLSIMKKMPIELQAKHLLSLSKQVSAHRREILKLTEYYVQGNIQQLHRSARRGMGDLRKLLLWERNDRMADRIHELIREQSCFCAVGAGHLWGEKGVLKLLKDQGNEVKGLPW
jgi:uncharacterized protein YbaP (TraB family)